MCSTYYADESTEEKIRQLTNSPGLSMRRGDIRPSESTTLLTRKGDGLTAEDMKWGFLRSDGRGLLINARAETITERRTFRESVLSRRCVIPAKGFYEWSPRKEKYHFEETGKTLFMAGCYDSDHRFVIITTAANESVQPVHDRMPLLLLEEEIIQWITQAEYMTAILQKTPQMLKRWTTYQQMNLFDLNM